MGLPGPQSCYGTHPWIDSFPTCLLFPPRPPTTTDPRVVSPSHLSSSVKVTQPTQTSSDINCCHVFVLFLFEYYILMLYPYEKRDRCDKLFGWKWIPPDNDHCLSLSLSPHARSEAPPYVWIHDSLCKISP